jgi:hypothetical protein
MSALRQTIALVLSGSGAELASAGAQSAAK